MTDEALQRLWQALQQVTGWTEGPSLLTLAPVPLIPLADGRLLRLSLRELVIVPPLLPVPPLPANPPGPRTDAQVDAASVPAPPAGPSAPHVPDQVQQANSLPMSGATAGPEDEGRVASGAVPAPTPLSPSAHVGGAPPAAQATAANDSGNGENEGGEGSGSELSMGEEGESALAGQGGDRGALGRPAGLEIDDGHLAGPWPWLLPILERLNFPVLDRRFPECRGVVGVQPVEGEPDQDAVLRSLQPHFTCRQPDMQPKVRQVGRSRLYNLIMLCVI